jgi:hypothetical protein
MCNLLKNLQLCLLGTLSIAILCYAEPTLSEKEYQEEQLRIAQEPGAVKFVPPSGWFPANPKDLPKSVKIMVVGKGQHEFPPSISLGAVYFDGTLKEYLKTIKARNEAQGIEWKDLGTIRTDAGNASLSQVDMKTQWGTVREMHVILIKNKTAFILTSAALKEEFPNYYKDFFASMRSLHINKDAYEMVANSKRRSSLEEAKLKVENGWNTLFASSFSQKTDITNEDKLRIFNSDSFQNEYWLPFKQMLNKDYKDMGVEWQNYLLTNIQNLLIGKQS